MKKNTLKIVIFIITALWISTLNVNAETAEPPTLDQIIGLFNNSTAVQDYTSSGLVSLTAVKSGNNIEITYKYTDTNNTEGAVLSTYTLDADGKKLSTTCNNDDDVPLQGFIKYYTTAFLVDSIGKYHGYEYGDLMQTLMSDDILNYTYDNEGYQVTEQSENNYKVDIDISKKIPLMDFSDIYVTVEDLESYKDIITNEQGYMERTVGNIWFRIDNKDGEVTVLIAEKNNLTVNTYNSMLSILEVMFESEKVVDYFKNNYPTGFTTNKEFPGFKIEVNPTKTEFESNLINESYKFTRVKINKEEVKSALNINENQAPADQKVNVPNTGKNTLIIGILFGIILISTGIGVYYHTLRKKQVSN